MPGLRWKVLWSLLSIGLLVAWGTPARGGHATTPAVYGWGNNASNQLGYSRDFRRIAPGVIHGTERMVSVTAGAAHVLAVDADGTVWGWGNNFSWQLGHESGRYPNPVQIPGLGDVASVAAGWDHNLAVKADGTVWAWGAGTYGQLGNGEAQSQRVPVQVVGLTDAVSVAASSTGSMALKRDGTVWAWGNGGQGLLGNGSQANSAVPVQVPNLSDVVAITAAHGNHVALKSDGTVWWWGANTATNPGSPTYGRPMQVQISDVAAIEAGFTHVLALDRWGRVWAWGTNTHGQLGDGTRISRGIPVLIPNLTNVVSISAGGSHSAALKADGTVWMWGSDYDGQLGVGVRPDAWDSSVLVPTLVPFLHDVTTISLGHDYTLAQAPFADTPPVVMFRGPYTVEEGSRFLFNPVVANLGGDLDLAYQWDFGDGSSSEEANPLHAFRDDGIYTVTLTVTNSAGQSGSATATVRVTNVAPTGTIHGPPSGTVNAVGSELEFRAYVGDATLADTLTARWIFTASDGTEIVVSGEVTTVTRPSNIVERIATARHRFTAPGSYAVRLEVMDDDGGVGVETTVLRGEPAVVKILPVRDGTVSGSGRIRVGYRNDTKFQIAVKVRRGKPSGVVQISHGGPRIKLKAKDIETVAIGSDGVAYIRARGRNRSGEYLVYLTVVDGKPDRVRLRMVPQFPFNDPIDNQPHLGLGDLPGADAAVMLGTVFVRAH